MQFNSGIIFLCIISILTSCKKENVTDHLGPEICASANFQYIQQPTLSSTSVNLSASPLVLKAIFNESVPWSIQITGTMSKAFKKFSGFGDTINISWQGNPDSLLFFQTEQCTATFNIGCKPLITETFTITTVGSFSHFNYLAFSGTPGAALTTLYGPPYGYGNPGTTTTMVSGMNPPIPQGGQCLCTHAVSATPSYYFGGYDLTGTLGTNVLNDPTQVYFNCFVNVLGSELSIPVVVFTEGTSKRSKNILVYGQGWQYVSFPLSDANVVNPQNISITSFTLNAYPNMGTTGDMCISFVSFTNHAPFINLGTSSSQ